ncbi:photosystem II reaction center PsbP [Pseudanabaena sp. PCC 6802]|uniref:photosystem II reaction center PsbP n=1 Tax=Pseudanabaena sp. PCC 6802 TaxID=118173 RepID=UPI00034C2062|nr:photosystem II reaction center PsbP [Pseudanabaena sp. PCC 6802]
MFKRAVCIILMMLTIGLSGCVSSTNGLVPFVDSKDGYSFLYPNGWLQTSLKNGPDVIFHDIIEQAENVSVVISKLSSVKDLGEIGSASDVGLKVKQKVIAASGSGREAELINAELRDVNGKDYYLLEYAVRRATGELRHDLVNVTTNRGNLYTLSVSTSENRWPKVKDMFYKVATSFSVQQ